jgi:hypothetical protein
MLAINVKKLPIVLVAFCCYVGIVACARESMGIFRVDGFLEEVYPEQNSAIGVIGQLRSSEGDTLILGDEDNNIIVISDSCLDRFINNEVMIRFSPRESYDSDTRTVFGYIFARIAGQNNYDPDEMYCDGEYDDPAWG